MVEDAQRVAYWLISTKPSRGRVHAVEARQASDGAAGHVFKDGRDKVGLVVLWYMRPLREGEFSDF